MIVKDDGTTKRIPLSMRVVEWAREQASRVWVEPRSLNDGPPSLRFAGGRQEPWCGHFVATGHRELGAPIPGDVVPTLTRANPLASVDFMERVFREHGWFYRAPEPGRVILLLTRDGSDRGPGRHCGIVVQVTRTHVISVDGNYGHRVAFVERRLSDRLISGYGERPDPERQHA